jgi:hypothetical protein
MKRAKTPPQPGIGLFSVRRTILHEPKRCSSCGTGLAKGTEALYNLNAHTVSCIECPTLPERTPWPKRSGG